MFFRKESQIMRTRRISLIVATVLVLGFIGGLSLAQMPVQGQPDWKARFRSYDRNQDGRIDRAEFQEWMVEVFYFRDKNSKGYLVFEDVRGVMAPETLKAINRKGDGKLTRGEFLNAVFVDFDAADVNKNGAVTMEEIEAYINRSGK
jgi:Ca2+-binding EF-hand superfamily protein